MVGRRVFFWLEKLKVSPSERKTVSVLMTLLMILGILNIALAPSSPFGADHYNELEQQFRQRTELIRSENQKLMERYHPPVLNERAFEVVVSDTIPPDSALKAEQNPSDPISEKQKINVNTATAEMLQKLPGIGPAYSKRIIQYREEHGEFSSIEELIKIKGIGKKRLEKLRPFVKL